MLSTITRTVVLILALALVTLMFPLALYGGDDLGPNREKMKNILKNVSSEVAKNFYDPNLKGLDWKALTEEAKNKIEKANNIQEMQAAVFELLERLDDSHTIYFPPWMTEEPVYGFDVKPFGNEIRVYDIARNGAAEKAGLRVGDRVHQLQGYEVDRDSVVRLLSYTRMLYAVSPLELVVSRPGEGPLLISIRPQIERHSLIQDRYNRYSELWSFVTERGKYDPDYKKKYLTWEASLNNGVGYVEIKRFGFEREDFLKALVGKVRDGQALILDLRDCPGGYTETLLSFAGLFESEDTVMGETVWRKKTEPLKIPAVGNPVTTPLVVLVDSTTSSAAEMLARHLQRTKKAFVVGDRTAGMVTTSYYLGMKIGTSLVTTYGVGVAVARVLLGEGEELEKKGVTPDVVCIPTQDDMKANRDVCRDLAHKLAKEAIGKAKAATSAAKVN